MARAKRAGSSEPSRPKAARPADLARLFLDRANAGDVDGVVALYESDAVLAFPPGQITVGAKAIREVYAQFCRSARRWYRRDRQSHWLTKMSP